MTEFGRLLEAYRLQQGLGQKELARKAGVDPSYVSRLRSGERMPEAPIAWRLADGLGVPWGQKRKLLEAAGVHVALPPAIALLLEWYEAETWQPDRRPLLRIIDAAVEVAVAHEEELRREREARGAVETALQRLWGGEGSGGVPEDEAGRAAETLPDLCLPSTETVDGAPIAGVAGAVEGAEAGVEPAPRAPGGEAGAGGAGAGAARAVGAGVLDGEDDA